jgi:glycosyltransferase involved in cell wall biosynthesis
MRAFGRPLLAPIVERLTGVPTQLDLASVGAWVFPSESVRNTALRRWNLPATAVVHQGIDHSLFRPAPRPSWSWRMVYVGRIDPRKGLDLAIRSLRHLPEASTLTIVGSGDAAYMEELRRLSREAGVALRLEFVGQVTRDALRAVYATADVVVFPVLWEEPWGLVPLEAMGVGTPVVATGRGGSGEYLRHDSNCLIFDPNQGPEAIAAAVSRLAGSQELQAGLRQGGFATAKSMSEEDFDEAVEAALLRAARAAGSD